MLLSTRHQLPQREAHVLIGFPNFHSTRRIQRPAQWIVIAGDIRGHTTRQVHFEKVSRSCAQGTSGLAVGGLECVHAAIISLRVRKEYRAGLICNSEITGTCKEIPTKIQHPADGIIPAVDYPSRNASTLPRQSSAFSPTNAPCACSPSCC